MCLCVDINIINMQFREDASQFTIFFAKLNALFCYDFFLSYLCLHTVFPPLIIQSTGMLATARHQSLPWVKAVSWFDESHSGEMGSMDTDHMWRFQGPDKFTSLLIICVSRERNVIHRHLQWEFLPWHSCDLFRFRHDVLEKKGTLIKKSKASYRHHITNALHFKNQWNNSGSHVKCEAVKKIS